MIIRSVPLSILLILAFALPACAVNGDEEATVSATAVPVEKIEAAVETAEVASETPDSSEAPLAVPTEEAPVFSELPVLGAAPEWNNDVWINSETALPLQDLRGKVVLLEFWAFG